MRLRELRRGSARAERSALEGKRSGAFCHCGHRPACGHVARALLLSPHVPLGTPPCCRAGKIAAMNTKQAMARLEALGDEKRYAFNAKRGAGDNQFGVKTGDIRKLAKEIKANHELGLSLWETGNADAQMLAILLVRPKEIDPKRLGTMAKEGTCEWVADWLHSYVIKKHPERETVREKWMRSKDAMVRRAGWSLTAERVAKNPEGLDLGALLDRLEREMPTAPPQAQWTMNTCLAYIGIYHAEYRDRALAIGEALGLYQDYPQRKGCTSPYAPIYINEMVSRREA